MKIYYEKNLSDFKAWGPAKKTLSTLTYDEYHAYYIERGITYESA